jgi:hypothetical protein
VVLRRANQSSADLTLAPADIMPGLKATTSLPVTFNVSLVVTSTARVTSQPVFVPLTLARS